MFLLRGFEHMYIAVCYDKAIQELLEKTAANTNETVVGTSFYPRTLHCHPPIILTLFYFIHCDFCDVITVFFFILFFR